MLRLISDVISTNRDHLQLNGTYATTDMPSLSKTLWVKSYDISWVDDKNCKGKKNNCLF